MSMNPGKALELLVKRILINVGFSEVPSDGVYIYDGVPGQMIQGLGEAHNADVLLEPPVQIPFYSQTRLLIECKDYRRKVNLNIVRSAFGLREDINNFNIIDQDELESRRRKKYSATLPVSERYSYQVAVAAMKGFTIPAQRFASAHRIPLIEFNKLPFWRDFQVAIEDANSTPNERRSERTLGMIKSEEQLNELADTVGRRMAVAVTNSGQLLFLYHEDTTPIRFEAVYSLHWQNSDEPWTLRSGADKYSFQLPDDILKNWLNNSTSEIELKREAIHYKEQELSRMIVYYTKDGKPVIQMISIDQEQLKDALDRLK